MAWAKQVMNWWMSDMAENWLEIADVSDLPNGERLFFEVDETPIVILNLGGALFAIEDVCTHDNGPLGDGEVEGHVIVCPRHGARFDLRDGRVVSPPAVEPVQTFLVKIENQKIWLNFTD